MEPIGRHEIRARVLLVGGAPLSGKTTLAHHIATVLGWDHLHGDDLATAARTFAPEPLSSVLDPMRGYDWREYYLAKSLHDQVEKAIAAHRAAWPAFEPIIQTRSTWARPAVIDWWGFMPELVRASLIASAPSVKAFWLHIPGDLFASRLNPDFYHGARDEPSLIAAFAQRSNRFNEYYGVEAQSYGLPILTAERSEDVVSLAFRALTMISS